MLEKVKREHLKIKYNSYLLLASAIWGFAFVAQRLGAQVIGAFTFNGIRFALGSITIVPLLIIQRKRKNYEKCVTLDLKYTLKAGIIAGCALFLASSLQQIGLAYTSAGKAAFITGLYIILVPVLGIFFSQTIRITTWASVCPYFSGHIDRTDISLKRNRDDLKSKIESEANYESRNSKRN